MAQKLDTRAFIAKARAVHGERYDYSRVEYRGREHHVIIGCPEHGFFEQRPYIHGVGSGCPKCGNTTVKLGKSKDLKWFIAQAQTVHGLRYDYSQSVYSGTMQKIEIICPEHGMFSQQAGSHLSGCGCNNCGNLTIGRKLSASSEDFITKAEAVHGTRYDYSNVVFINHRTKVEIICPIHGPFLKSPHMHISSKQGCQKCARCTMGGWSKTAWQQKQNGRKAILYLIELFGNGEVFYKVGITFNLQSRFNTKTLPYAWRTVALFKSYDAAKVFELEKQLHHSFKHLDYLPGLPFHGRTECFASALEIISALPPGTFFLKNRPVI